MKKKWIEFTFVLVVLSALTLAACGYSTEELSKDW
jgi:predicted small secreted protein